MAYQILLVGVTDEAEAQSIADEVAERYAIATELRVSL